MDEPTERVMNPLKVDAGFLLRLLGTDDCESSEDREGAAQRSTRRR